MSLSDNIRDYALSAGYDRVGFTTADSFPLYEQVLNERQTMYDWAIEGSLQIRKSVNPKNILPEARSIVVAVYDFLKHSYPGELVNKVGRIYQSTGSIPPMAIQRARYRLVRDYLEKNGCMVGRSKIDVPARLTGARAGVTNFGKNCFAYADGIGSFIVINTFVIDKELEYNEPTLKLGCPEKCTVCIDACPTGALYEPLKMNPRRCIAYNSYATPGSFFGEGQDAIPPEIRGKMGTWIFGCDVCQQVCPRNQARLKMNLPPNAFLDNIAGDFRLDRLLNMSDEHYSRVYELLTYIKDKRYYRRNAAVAMGNLGNTEFIPNLKEAMSDPFEVVRGHAAWALGKIGGTEAQTYLESRLKIEDSKYVLNEITGALSG